MISQSILGTPASGFEEDDNDQDYETQADDIIEKVWRIFKDEDSWSPEAKSSDGSDVVVSKTYPKWGKVFRLTVSKRIFFENKRNERVLFQEYHSILS